MKRSVLFISIIIGLISAGAFAQGKCDFNIVGDWKIAGPAGPVYASFSADGTVVIRSAPARSAVQRELASGTYKLDFPKAPKAIELTAVKAGAFLTEGTSSMSVAVGDESTITSAGSGVSMKW